MKKHIVVFVASLLFSSIACWANVAPEFRHPCQGPCCIAGANPGTYSLCTNATKTCSPYCTVPCNGEYFECGRYVYTASGCVNFGKEIIGSNTCSEANMSAGCSDIDFDGHPTPCDSNDCTLKKLGHNCLD